MIHLKLENSYPQIWKISYPIILSAIAQNIINFTNTAFLGHVGEIELGASAIAGIYYFTFIMVGWGIGSGTQIIIARRLGQQKFSDIGTVFHTGNILLIIMAIITMLLMLYLSPLLLGTTLTSQGVFKASIDYLDIRAWGIVFALLNVGFRALFVGIAQTRIILWSTFFMSILNAVLDYLLIFGNYGFPEMGIKGAALASVIAELSATIIFILYCFYRIDIKKFGLFRFESFDTIMAKTIFRISLPVMAQHLISLGGWFIFFLFVEQMGEHELAISNIARSIYMVIMIPVWGFNSSVNTMVSNFIGQGNESLIKKIILKNVVLSLMSSLVMVQISIWMPEKILSLYTNDVKIIQDGISVLYILSGSMIILSVSWVLFNAVLGTGDTIYALLIEIVCITIYLIYVWCIIIVLKQPLYIAWSSEYVYIGLMGILSYIYIKSNKWKKVKV